MGVGAGLYMYDVVVKSSRSLSHLLVSSCFNMEPRLKMIKLIARAATKDLVIYGLLVNVNVHVRYMLSPVRLSVCLSSVCRLSICNVRAPYSGN